MSSLGPPFSGGFPSSPSNLPGSRSPYHPSTRSPTGGASGEQHAFRTVRSKADLLPAPLTGKYRPSDEYGRFISPLQSLTVRLVGVYARCNPSFNYEPDSNPRRVLTKPSKGVRNDGYDNEDGDYILCVNDTLGSDERQRYRILDMLGSGTFGQVVKCQNLRTNEFVAIKVVKNKPAYYNQSLMEVSILELLNKRYDPKDEHRILRLLDHFTHKSHLCLVFELMSVNLYELIKQNQFRGLSTNLVRVFTAQMLDAMTVLNEAKIIHCDLKPENVLLKNLESPSIKIIDFGSACHEHKTIYTYIQSRFYRSPEVLLGLPYSSAIDVWSLGCIAAELFLGLPLFPGHSEYDQISRIVDMVGLPPSKLIEFGKSASNFFNRIETGGRPKFTLKTVEEYSRENSVQEKPSKRYFNATTLPDIIKNYPIHRKGLSAREVEKEKHNRVAFVDFLQGLLNLNPFERWSPQQAKLHPFITGEEFTGKFQPPMVLPPKRTPTSTTSLTTTAAANATPPKISKETRPRSNTTSKMAFFTDLLEEEDSLPPSTLTAAQRDKSPKSSSSPQSVPFLPPLPPSAYPHPASTNSANSSSNLVIQSRSSLSRSPREPSTLTKPRIDLEDVYHTQQHLNQQHSSIQQQQLLLQQQQQYKPSIRPRDEQSLRKHNEDTTRERRPSFSRRNVQYAPPIPSDDPERLAGTALKKSTSMMMNNAQKKRPPGTSMQKTVSMNGLEGEDVYSAVPYDALRAREANGNPLLYEPPAMSQTEEMAINLPPPSSNKGRNAASGQRPLPPLKIPTAAEVANVQEKHFLHSSSLVPNTPHELPISPTVYTRPPAPPPPPGQQASQPQTHSSRGLKARSQSMSTSSKDIFSMVTQAVAAAQNMPSLPPQAAVNKSGVKDRRLSAWVPASGAPPMPPPSQPGISMSQSTSTGGVSYYQQYRANGSSSGAVGGGAASGYEDFPALNPYAYGGGGGDSLLPPAKTDRRRSRKASANNQPPVEVTVSDVGGGGGEKSSRGLREWVDEQQQRVRQQHTHFMGGASTGASGSSGGSGERRYEY